MLRSWSVVAILVSLLHACLGSEQPPEPAPDPVCDLPNADSGTLTDSHKGFETGTLSGWTPELAADHSGRVVTEPVRCGAFAGRFELRPGDEAGPIGGRRAELHEIGGFIAPPGSEQWYRFSMLVPDEWPSLPRGAVVAQWHGTPDLAAGEVWRSPPLAVRYSGDVLEVTGRHSNVAVQSANDGAELALMTSSEPLARGEWHDWVFRVRWSPDDDGLVDAWLNGAQVVEYRGPIGYNDERGPWFKWGIYRGGQQTVAETTTIFHDEYRRGLTCEAVAPELCTT